jgi:hypothetical protein
MHDRLQDARLRDYAGLQVVQNPAQQRSIPQRSPQLCIRRVCNSAPCQLLHPSSGLSPSVGRPADKIMHSDEDPSFGNLLRMHIDTRGRTVATQRSTCWGPPGWFSGPTCGASSGLLVPPCQGSCSHWLHLPPIPAQSTHGPHIREASSSMSEHHASHKSSCGTGLAAAPCRVSQ